MAHVPPSKRKKSHEHDIHKFLGKESILTSQINLFVEEAQPKIPDGGWGWVVVLAAFVLNSISEGIGFSFGLFYIEFLKEFDASKSATSWVGSLFLAMPLLAGPLCSALVDRYGCIRMTILGGIVCTIGFVLSFFANSIGLLYLTFGIIGGIGRGLTYITAVVPIAFWFEKRRTIALGLAASGSGFGTIVFPPLTTVLMFEYNWRGTLLVLAGFFFNMCVCGTVMRDPKWIIEEEREKKAIKSTKKANDAKKKRDGPLVLQRVSTSPDLKEKDRFRSTIDLPTFLRENEKVPFEVLKQLSENKHLYKIVLENYPNLLSSKSTSNRDLHALEGPHSKVPITFSMTVKKTEDPIPEEEEESEISTQMIRSPTHPLLPSNQWHHSHPTKRTPSHSYLHQIKLKKNSIWGNRAESNVDNMQITVSNPDVYRTTVIPGSPDEKTEWYVEFFSSIKNILNFSLFLELHFFALAVSTTILYTWFIVPYFYLAEHMTRNGYTDAQASFALSAIGFTNTAGMVILGWAGNKLNIGKTYAACLLLCGISTGSMMLFSNNYVLLIINSALFGLFFASCFSLLPSLLAELVPLEDFTMAYGLILMCMGVGNLTGPPLAGFLFDLTNSWDQSFYQAAFWIIICGILVGIIPYTKNRKMGSSGPTLNEKAGNQMNDAKFEG